MMNKKWKIQLNSYQKKNQKNILEFIIIHEIKFKILKFKKKNNHLRFVLEHWTKVYKKSQPKVKHSEKVKVLKDYDKIINPVKFVNEQLKNLMNLNIKIFQNQNLEQKLINKVIKKIGIKPFWKPKKRELIKKEIEIKTLKKCLRSYENEKMIYDFKPTNYQEKSDKLWLSLLLAPITLGFSLFDFVSKNRAWGNQQLNKKNQSFNQQHKADIDQYNLDLKQKIKLFNDIQYEHIALLKNQYEMIKNMQFDISIVEKWGWIDLRSAFGFSVLKNQSYPGVYLIWNKSKNKYYVGQSKNIGKRIFTQHFNKDDVKNIIFARDWFNGDEFKYKYFICESTEQLNGLEKKYIDIFDAYKTGYNSTGGNN